MEAYISMISAFGCNFVIQNWGSCSGAILPIAQNTALFSLLGTVYGGDGRVTYGLPDLRARAPVSWGHGPGLSFKPLGSADGVEQVRLTASEMPVHDHLVAMTGQTVADATALPVSADAATLTDPDSGYLATTGGTLRPYAATLSDPAGSMGPVVVPPQSVALSGNTDNTGAAEPIYTRSPYQAVNYQICMYGIFPSRS